MSFGPSVASRLAPETPTDGAGLAAEGRLHDRSTAERTIAFGEFAAYGDWALEGYANPVQWLKDRWGMTGQDAYRMAQEAKKLRVLPVLAEAWVNGEVTGGQVRIICMQVIDRHLDLFAQHEAEIVRLLHGLSIDDTLAAMRLWRERADALNEGPEPDDRCTAKLSPTLDDRGLLTANLDPEGYAYAKAALDAADSEDLDEPAAIRRGEALTAIFKFFVDHQDDKLGRRNRPHLNVVINAATLGTAALEGYFATTGMTTSPSTLQRLMCDGEFHRLLHANGEILDYGRATRRIPNGLYNAVLLRDQGCRWKGCDRPPNQCDVHHVDEYSAGGETNIARLVMQCGHHHTELHKPGYHAEMEADGTFTVTPPRGPKWTTKPRLVQTELPIRGPDRPNRSPIAEHLEALYVLARLEAQAEQRHADLVIHFDHAA
jgi:uncharacterized protein DUF222